MGISVAVIMKNEEDNVIDFINSCLQFADEIVINDTGSTDRSIQRALAFEKVVLYQTKWSDDFSKARNLAIDLCAEDWIIWLDLDDRVDAENAERFKLIANHKDKKDVFLFNVKCKQHNSPYTLDIIQTRMFHRDSGIRFNRRIHESVEESIIKHNLDKVYASEVSIYHEGYGDFELLKKKAKRNISILNKEESSFGNYYDLGKSYAVLHKYLMTELFFTGAYELAETDEQRNLIATSMLNFLLEEGNIEKVDKWFDKLVGESKQVCYYKAESYYLKKEYSKARVYFKLFLEKQRENSQLFHYSDVMTKRACQIIEIMDNVDKKNVA